MMSRFPLWARFVLGFAMLLPMACNLTNVDPTRTPPPSPTITVTVNPPTFTPTPTNTVIPTATKIPSAPKPTGTPIYRLSQPLPSYVCAIVPNVDASNIRSGPGTNFPVIGVMPAGNWVMPSRLANSGWYQIVALGTVVNGGWISSTVVDLQQPCICTPDACTESGIVPPIASVPSSIPGIGLAGLKPSGAASCVITAGDVDLEVYNSPQGLPPVIAKLIAHRGMPATDYRDLRYAITFSTETQLLVGWVNANRVTIEGDCARLTTPIICSVQSSTGQTVGIYAEPKRDAKLLDGMNEFSTKPFIQSNPDGWFSVNLGFAGSGWIAPDEGRLVGPCDNGQ